MSGISCPALEFATTLSEADVPIYLFRDDILDPVEVAMGYIVPHTWEVRAVWGPDLEIRIRCEQQNRRSGYLFRGDGGGKRLKPQTDATEMEVIPAHKLEVCDFWRRMSARTSHEP